MIIGDDRAFDNMDLGVAAKLLVSNLCGVDERDAKEILELAAINNQKIVAICPKRARYSTSSRNKDRLASRSLSLPARARAAGGDIAQHLVQTSSLMAAGPVLARNGC